jgi:short-subunit dehydrogenase
VANLALVTGASGGIGAELAKIHAGQGGDLVLVARSADKLEKLKSELERAHEVAVALIVQDLSEPGAASRVAEKVEELGLEVDVLINNAGIGGHGKFHECDLSAHQQMMQLNMVTLTELTHLFLPGMVKRGRGRILNVSSTAGFMPGPLQAVYYATKAYVNSFSQAIANELSGTGVSVTALCPGAVATDFQRRGDLEGIGLWDKAPSASSVAEVGYRAMEAGELVSFNDGSLRFALNWIIPLLPRRTVLSFSRRSMEKS